MQKLINFPTLSESAFLRYFNFSALYFAEGLAQGMLFVGIPAWMAMQGKSPGEIGSFAVACSLPWTFKFIIAPLMDRYTYLPMGRKRPWVLISHLGLMLSIIGFAFVPDPLNNLNTFMLAAFLVSTFGAMQDAAGDAMAVDVVPPEQQARANGYMQGSRMVGSSLSLVLCSWILNEYSFEASMLTLFCLVAVITIVPIVLREQKGEKIFPFTAGKASEISKDLQISDWKIILKALYKVFRLKNSLLVVILLFITQGAYNFFEHLLPIFAVKITGWTNLHYSQSFATADLIGGIMGMLAGGYLIEKFGKKLMINIYFFLIIMLVVALNYGTKYWQDSEMLNGFIIVYRLINAFAKIGVFAIAMQCCSKNISASQFTIFMTMGAVGSIAGAFLIGPIKDNFDWNNTFIFFGAFIALAWAVLQFINISQQVEKISEIEQEI
ncbi:PAT family beta-lactamase induction signal transducer AmpG [Flavobacterium sp. PL11]|jgi:PAT family beta-lactamase induction signal transducer AmpG|uniref:MFS transporter n=1 Tax=Flavobacterium sp. PL11 TaxID=3071717 RepID=UPI002DFA9A8B|nr:PAT family beta-lactamase induction signal transducer AmpG [Flavobacterium sp. PL11]